MENENVEEKWTPWVRYSVGLKVVRGMRNPESRRCLRLAADAEPTPTLKHMQRVAAQSGAKAHRRTHSPRRPRCLGVPEAPCGFCGALSHRFGRGSAASTCTWPERLRLRLELIWAIMRPCLPRGNSELLWLW